MQSHARGDKVGRARETNEKMVELSRRHTIGNTVLFWVFWGYFEVLASAEMRRWSGRDTGSRYFKVLLEEGMRLMRRWSNCRAETPKGIPYFLGSIVKNRELNL